MTIYLDIVFVVNFGINFLFSYLILNLFNERVNMFRIIASSIFAGIMMISMLFDIVIYNLFKIFGGLVLTYLGLGMNRFLIKASIFYILQFSLTGIVQSFGIRDLYLIIGIIIIIILIIILNFRKKCIYPRHLQYNVSVTLKKEATILRAFLDTGNNVSYNNIPVIFIDGKYNCQMNVYGTIEVKTVNSISIMNCYKPEKFILFNKKRKIEMDVLIAFTNLEKPFECLLNYNLL